MAFTVFSQPITGRLCSTIIPLVWKVYENSADTTNIVAQGEWYNQQTGVTTFVGWRYRMSPNINVPFQWKFDGSELFNTLTKYTLDDADGWKIGSVKGFQDSLISWENIMTFAVYVKFYREYLDAADGLIKIDPTGITSWQAMVHEGAPEKNWIKQIVATNGWTGGESTFEQFNSQVEDNGIAKRYFTNYPIEINHNGEPTSTVSIHESEQYMLCFRAKQTSNGGNLASTYRMRVITYGSSGTLGNHIIEIPSNNHLQTISVGFFDMVNNLTPSALEGSNPANPFANVKGYHLRFESCYIASTSGCTGNWVQGLTNYNFKVNRACIKNTGYTNFVFKNQMGGFDMVSSWGKKTKKGKDKFEMFEQTLGYDEWDNPMRFGKSNWANKNVERYSIETQLMKKSLADHFAEMCSSTQVYVRVPNVSYKKVLNDNFDGWAREQPFVFYPIVIKGATRNISKSTENYASIKFTYEMAVNQRIPRY